MSSKHVTQAQERAFFDNQAKRAVISAIDPRIVQRYTSPGELFSREFLFRTLGDLRGKTILDVGCGEGEDAVLLSLLGARVTGVDLSEGAVAVARKRCEVNGISNASFVVGPIETTPLGTYDIVFVEALLHHVIPDLDAVIAKLLLSVKPGGVIIMCEPVNLFPALRKFRLLVGPPPIATPDERPLEARELDILQARIPNLQCRYFRAFARADRLFLRGPLERAGALTRSMVYAMYGLDHVCLRVPGFHRSASVAVMWGRVNEQTA